MIVAPELHHEPADDVIWLGAPKAFVRGITRVVGCRTLERKGAWLNCWIETPVAVTVVMAVVVTDWV